MFKFIQLAELGSYTSKKMPAPCLAVGVLSLEPESPLTRRLQLLLKAVASSHCGHRYQFEQRRPDEELLEKMPAEHEQLPEQRHPDEEQQRVQPDLPETQPEAVQPAEEHE